MELEEAEDEERYPSKYSFKNNARNGCKMRRWMLKRGLCLGRTIIVAGFVASAPVVVPPLVVASAIGIALSMPCAFFLASHACTQCLMSKLLPMPTPQDTNLLREEICFQPASDVIHSYKEEESLADETKRGVEIDYDVQYMKNGENMTLESECGPQEEDATDGMEGRSRGETNGVVTMIEEFKTPFDVTTLVLEESQEQAMQGDIEEAELQRETKGLLEKIRDEGSRTDMTQERGKEYVERICGEANDSDQKIGPAVEDMEVAWNDTHSGFIEGTEEEPNVCEEMLHTRNDQSKDTILEGKEFDNINDSQEPMPEPSELLIPAEPNRDLSIEALVYNISVDDDSSEVISENIDILIVTKDEPEPPLDCPTSLQDEKLDNNNSDFENQESQLQELNERMYSIDAEAIESSNEGALDLFDGKQIDPDEYACTIDLQGSSNVDGHTDSMEVLVSSVEESRPSECSSGENMVCPSQEVVLDEEKIWEEINVIRKIVGYEGRMEASCSDELKALYIFTGVEPPTTLDSDPAEIKEKLHFLMSIVGIKSNDA